MAVDDRLYDPMDAPDHRFLVYSSNNAYITPYSSDTHGGELITEFNQRAAWNTLLKREVSLKSYAQDVAQAVNDFVGIETEVDSTTGATTKVGPGLNSFVTPRLRNADNWGITAYATGTRDVDDFHLALDPQTGKITVSAGVALVYGYYVESLDEIKIAKTDAISVAEINQVSATTGQVASNPCLTKFIKLAVQYTAPEHSVNDERLIAPLNGVYQGAAIVINNELPYGNELLLGTVTCDTNGVFMLTENPNKTRLIPLDGVDGTENYPDLISAPTDNHIYGIMYGGTDGSTEHKVTNLKNIDPWLWLHFNSNLGKLLRSFSTGSSPAPGQPNDAPTRGLIVSDVSVYSQNVGQATLEPIVDQFNCLQRIDSMAKTDFARMTWHQTNSPGNTGDAKIDYRALFLQYASSRLSGSALTYQVRSPQADDTIKKPVYNYPVLNNLSGNDGIMTAQQIAMLELTFDDYINRRSDGYARGRQYGPFLTLAAAKDWFETMKPEVGLGDYFWVINDTAEAGGQDVRPDGSVQNIVTNYGSVSGTVTGTAKQSKLNVHVTGSVTGELPEGGSFQGEVSGEGQGTINATVAGTVVGTLDSFTQNVSSRYVCRYSKRLTTSDIGNWDFARAVEFGVTNIDDYSSPTQDPWTPGANGHFLGHENIRPGSVKIIPPVAGRNNLNGYLSSDVHDNAMINSNRIYDDGYVSAGVGILWGRVGTDSTWVQVGTINYQEGRVYGIRYRSGTSGTVAYPIVNYSYVDEGGYTVLDQNDFENFQHKSNDPAHPPYSILFALEAVERGFAIPATADEFGLVKTGTGSAVTDVIVDPTTQRLRIGDLLYNMITGGGFIEYPYEEIHITPAIDLTAYAYRRYNAGVLFKMEGLASEWRAALESTGTLAHLRGKITLDFSEVVEDGQRIDGLLLNLVDIDQLTFVGDNQSTSIHVSTESLAFGVDHCVVDAPFFTNIGEWRYSQFISGGNTLELKLPWMEVPNAFTNAAPNSLLARFASITMGEYGITDATLDIWVKHEGWSDYSGNIDRVWSSVGYIKYPPLFFEHELNEEGGILTTINKKTMQHIPDNLNLKVSGTAGVHQSFDVNNDVFVPSGNLLVNLNWEYNCNPTTAVTPAGKVYLNLYMKNASEDDKKQNFSNLRFRANVQVIRLDNNSMAESVGYTELYEAIPTHL